MIILKNLNSPKSIPAVFNSEKEFIEYTLSEALWVALPTGEIPTMEKMGFIKVVDEVYSDEFGNTDEVVHWESDLQTCLSFWDTVPEEKWQVSFN